MATNDPHLDGMEGIETSQAQDSSPSLTSDELRILKMYQRMEELQFEIALLQQHGILNQAHSPESEIDIHKAQEDLLEAKAAHTVKSHVVSSVLVATPILNSVHAGSHASIIEQDLFPLVETRDEAAAALARLNMKVKSAREELVSVEVQHSDVARKNSDLAKTMLDLAKRASTSKADVADPKARQMLDDLEASVQMSRHRWRIMKGTASAVIAGSGKDWARDPKLLELVVDDDEEM